MLRYSLALLLCFAAFPALVLASDLIVDLPLSESWNPGTPEGQELHRFLSRPGTDRPHRPLIRSPVRKRWRRAWSRVP
ncbi:MAG: hypothetical protein QF492_05335 [Candidatus Krumholzibacteria bacterium]|nr:hypothetical protein [Candidatus Krumholzibacteria bacterium]